MFYNNPNLGEFMSDQDSTIIGNNNVVDQDMNIDINMSGNDMMGTDMNMEAMESQTPIMEPMQERVVNRTIMHNVPHICPIRTRIINHHIYRHTYSPQYSCCEENVCSNIQCGSCCSCNRFN